MKQTASPRLTIIPKGKRYSYLLRIRKPTLQISKAFSSVQEIKEFLGDKGVKFVNRYPNRIKVRAIELIVSGLTITEVAKILKLKRDSVGKWYRELYMPETCVHGYRYILTMESNIND